VKQASVNIVDIPFEAHFEGRHGESKAVPYKCHAIEKSSKQIAMPMTDCP
jgi:hypothetical protein